MLYSEYPKALRQFISNGCGNLLGVPIWLYAIKLNWLGFEFPKCENEVDAENSGTVLTWYFVIPLLKKRVLVGVLLKKLSNTKVWLNDVVL